MSRIMSIDYGAKRTGIAVTDPLQIIANGLATVQTSKLDDFIKDYINKENVECIVVGLAKQTNGEDSENMRRITPFVNKLKKTYPEIRVEFFDERFTSVLAHRAIIESGINKKSRQNKALVDQISATIILQDYLEARKNNFNNYNII